MEKAKAKTKKGSAPARSAAGKGLVIVESPAKAKTLKKYLGRGYDVKASVGHIMDLPKSELGVDVEKSFEPTYQIIKGKQKVIDEITEAAKKASKVYLAADPDREGEAIAWHVAQILNLPKAKIARVLFHEITKPAVLKALEEPIELNQSRFESQQARRILDRLVGYKISPILWAKVRRGLSAGRVQSVAVRLIVEREKEVKAFIPQAYWTVQADLQGEGKKFLARLVREEDLKIDRLTIDKEEWANEIVEACGKAPWKIASVTKKQRRRNPDPPFITSTLQQESSKRLYFSAKKTMMLAQQLYEGVEVGEAGAQGLITYMRTDSIRLSDIAIADARKLIEDSYGKEYLPEEPIVYKNKKNAQDAHEAVRPTSTEFPPERVKPFLDADQFKLYDLIWKRYLACQMSQAVFDQTSVDIDVQAKKKYGFRATGSVLRFDGFLRLWQTEDEGGDEAGDRLPDLQESSALKCDKVANEKHFTQPPPRYSESSLIKELEEKGIGRPSTYAAILSTIQDRKYVEKVENRFIPTDLGDIVTELLVENFKDIVDVAFTATMEDQLDKIEEGDADWVKTLKNFYVPFESTLAVAAEKMRDVKREETPTDLDCPKCGKKLVIKWGRNGKFIACQGYPECRFTGEFKTLPDGKIEIQAQPTTDEKCPNCSEPMMVKTGRFGRFLACSAYPKCKTTKPITTGIQCPECKQGELSQKRTRFGKAFYSCTRYPDCKYAIWDKPIKDRPCPLCQHPFITERYTKKDGASLRCPNKECGFTEKVPEAAGS
ncbi:type I DNA topoisomerase [bacterium]|nr:type I DNA topoisomerase [bacterium]